MFSNQLKNRFISDYNLNMIQVLQSPYFEYYLDLYEPYNQARTKWNKLVLLINEHFNGNEHLFLEEYAKQRDNIITSIEKSETYKEFNIFDMSAYNGLNVAFHKLPKSSVYIESNNGKKFISIDLRKANFQGLKFHNNELVNNTESYDEFIESYLGTNHPLLKYFQESKYSRQVIFGKLNMSRNITIQKSIMESVFESLSDLMEEYSTVLKYYSFSTDELIIEVLHPSDIPEIIQEMYYLINNKANVKIQYYKLELVNFLTSNNSTLSVYLKDNIVPFVDGKEIMCCPTTYFSQVYKLLNEREIEENDMIFYYEHQLAKFLTPLKIK